MYVIKLMWYIFTFNKFDLFKRNFETQNVLRFIEISIYDYLVAVYNIEQMGIHPVCTDQSG